MGQFYNKNIYITEQEEKIIVVALNDLKEKKSLVVRGQIEILLEKINKASKKYCSFHTKEDGRKKSRYDLRKA